MKRKKLWTIISLSTLSGALVVGSAIPLMVLNHNYQALPEGIDRNSLSSYNAFKKNMLTNSYTIGDQKYYRYDGQIFNSEQTLNEYIFNQGKIQAITTSSNPSKIIKDYEHEILDETKIFDTNIDNFVQVYEKGTGNITLNRENALQSFLSLADTVKEYSYDGIRWYDDEHKAQRAQNQDLKVNKSLYYLFDNRYYNAFNQSDIELLLSKMKEGYYLNFDKTLSGLGAPKIEEVFGEKANFADLLENKFRTDFYKNYHQQLIDFEGTNRLEVIPKDGSWIYINDKFQDDDLSNKSVEDELWWNNKGKSFTLVYSHQNFSSYYEMLNDFKDPLKWTEIKDYSDKDDNVYENYKHYIRKFDLIVDGAYKDNVILEVDHGWTSQKLVDFNSDFTYKDKTTGTIKYHLDPEKLIPWNRNGLDGDEMNNLYDPNLTNDQMAEFYKKWFDYYLNDVVLDFGIYNNDRPSWYMMKNHHYVENLNENFKAGDLYKDKMYEVNPGKGYTHSLIKSLNDWQQQKEQLIYETDAKDAEDVDHTNTEKRYPIFPNLLVNRVDLDNFLPLQGSGVDTRVMYSVANEEHASDLTGRWLAPTEVQAKELQRLYNQDSLKMRYLFYNNEGKLFGESYSDDKELAIQQLRNKLHLNSRFVHKNDLKGFDEELRPKKWSDLVSTGRYTVYRIDNPLNRNGIWFRSEEQALAAIKTDLKVANSLEELQEDYLAYNYLTDQGIILPIKYKESDLDQVARELYQLTYKRKEA